MRIKKVFCFILFGFLLMDLVGCESFVRKFTRKSKKSDQAVEMVLVPQEYKGPNMTKEELYRQSFLYWKSWQDELINALNQKANLKKKVDCAQQALKHLVNMKMLLLPDAQKNFDLQIAKSNELLSSMQSDVYGANDARNVRAANLNKANIEKDFIYPKIKNYLK
ncbi:MAG: hypothetical protein COV71_02520 [Candidatus Omnitrophica bacterium CG11_big_fil_rev_8_21_14_0_20_41_12]|nr:MAG: hypothetical protein COV71_02520 [Candidatus Omnitrophica bacterium CG11_big_fil_rev_8_21_14_0_20_41_12]